MMNNADVIKALDRCGYLKDCADCPLNGLGGIDKCIHTLMQNALDLINRLQAENSNLTSDLRSLQRDLTSANAEIERLQKQNEMNQINLAYAAGMPKTLASIKKMYATAKSEARKEFAERLNEIITESYNKHIFGDNDLEAEEKDAIINFSDDITYKIDNLLKELDGKENNEAETTQYLRWSDGIC